MRHSPLGQELSSLNHLAELRDRFFLWRGASGETYVLSVYGPGALPQLTDCADVLLIGVTRNGEVRPRCILRVSDSAPLDPGALARHVGEFDLTEWHALYGASAEALQDLSGALLH